MSGQQRLSLWSPGGSLWNVCTRAYIVKPTELAERNPARKFAMQLPRETGEENKRVLLEISACAAAIASLTQSIIKLDEHFRFEKNFQMKKKKTVLRQGLEMISLKAKFYTKLKDLSSTSGLIMTEEIRFGLGQNLRELAWAVDRLRLAALEVNVDGNIELLSEVAQQAGKSEQHLRTLAVEQNISKNQKI